MVYDLCEGLNLVSLPLANTGLLTANQLLASICGSNEATTIWRYLNDTKTFVAWTYLDTDMGWLTRAGMPFWVNVLSPGGTGCIWTVNGTIPTGVSYNLEPGINLVSLPVYTTNLPFASDILNNVPGCTGVWRWNRETDCAREPGFD